MPSSRSRGDRAKIGRLHRIQRAVYAVGYRKLTRHGHWMAAVLAYGPDAEPAVLDITSSRPTAPSGNRPRRSMKDITHGSKLAHAGFREEPEIRMSQVREPRPTRIGGTG